MKLFSIMRLSLAVSLLPSAFNAITYASEERELPVLLTPAKAEEIIKQRRENSKELERTRREVALDMPALEERVINQKDGSRIIFRRVAPAQQLVSERMKSDALSATEVPPTANFDTRLEYKHESISLGANVYGDQHSEITWRNPSTGEQLTVWTNVILTHLRPITSFQNGGVRYDYFGFTTYNDYESEQERLESARLAGYQTESRWKYPPVKFSSDHYEYFVDAPLGVEVPNKLYRQLDALFEFYLSNYNRFEIEYLNSKMLRTAHEKDLREHPPVKPKQVIMNYTPLRGEDAE